MELESRIREVERSMSRVRERVARLEQLTESIEGLRTAVDTLTATYNKGRGAIWVVGGAGALITLALQFLIRKFT